MVEESTERDEEFSRRLVDVKNKFLDAMDDDFNTPLALSIIFDLVRDVNRSIEDNNMSRKVLNDVKHLFIEFGEIQGLRFAIGNGKEDLTNDLIGLIIEIRQKIEGFECYLRGWSRNY